MNEIQDEFNKIITSANMPKNVDIRNNQYIFSMTKPKEVKSNTFNFNMNSIAKKESQPYITQKSRIRYIIVTDKGEIISTYKHDKNTIMEGLNKLDFKYLKPRYNKLPKENKNLIAYLAYEISTWDKEDRENIHNIISTLCDSPNRSQIFFDTINTLKCNSCFNIITKKRKCIHFDCNGMCKNCFEDIFDSDICPACNQHQIITCPICIEKWHVRSCKILKCGHGICFKCCNRSWDVMGEGIEVCPLCREDTTGDTSPPLLTLPLV